MKKLNFLRNQRTQKKKIKINEAKIILSIITVVIKAQTRKQYKTFPKKTIQIRSRRER